MLRDLEGNGRHSSLTLIKSWLQNWTILVHLISRSGSK